MLMDNNLNNELFFNTESCEQSETNFDDCDDAPLPTLEEVAARAKQFKENLPKPKVLPVFEGM